MICPWALRAKKPLPLMARSRLLPVWLMLPWVNCWAMAAVRTPAPATLPPVPRMEAEYTSANSAREALKPVVATLAMLLPVTARSLLAAARPLSATLNDMGELLSEAGLIGRWAVRCRAADAPCQPGSDAFHRPPG